MRRGLALIVVVGVLGVLAVLAAAFVTMAQLERKASQQRTNAAKAYLLARSGIEDALARFSLGQDPSYGGEDWDASGTLNGVEATEEVWRSGQLDTEGCPLRHAMRPSFFARDSLGIPLLERVEGRRRGYTGLLGGDHDLRGNAYALKVEDLNSRIHINGGALDALDRDPDGPNAVPEIAPLAPNGVPDYRDYSMEGPNGFLVRLLNNLNAVVTGGVTSNLGVQVVSARPLGGYKSAEELQAVLGQVRYDQFKPYLTVTAWVDPKVVKPQPMDGRPQRFQAIDDAHRVGTAAAEISGVKTSGGGNLQLNPGLSGSGTPLDPWVQTITATNSQEGTPQGSPYTYPVTWERNFLYAWSQLRLSPPAREARAPLSLNEASEAVLASAFLGLKGTYLETWSGSGGWDGGFGWFLYQAGAYPYPDQRTEDTPWHRTRVDYGMTYGTTIPSRPWYGPQGYDPHAVPWEGGGKSLIQAAPLGRLKETAPLTREQAMAIAFQVRQRVAQAGPFRTWEQFNGFVDRLPVWEDLNDDSVLDGAPYTVTGSGGTYTRRIYQREDLNSDGAINRQVFTASSGSWGAGPVIWADPGLGRAALGAGQVPGLTFAQKDVLKAMANPNTDLNDFNPDSNLFKEVDKTDLCGLAPSPGTAGAPWAMDPASAYVHTTELTLESMGCVRVSSLGRILAGDGRLLAQRQVSCLSRVWEIYRDTTQSDFMKGYNPGDPLQRPLPELFLEDPSGPGAPYPLSGGQPLLSYPEPQTLPIVGRWAKADYDGQVSLGFIAPAAGPDETLRGALFDTVDATSSGDTAVFDLAGPSHWVLLPGAAPSGNVFPDGVYSEKDRSLKYPLENNILDPNSGCVFYFACWTKLNWNPEASTRPHALVSLSRAGEGAFNNGIWTASPYDVQTNTLPLDDIPTCPEGLYYVPARNNSQLTVGVYDHGLVSTRGGAWPTRALLWGATHSLYASDCLNYRGLAPVPPGKPLGRLEPRRWQHLAMIAGAPWNSIRSRLILGRVPASPNGGGWNYGFGLYVRTLGVNHVEPGGGATPNHLRFGEIASENNMNYVADATFANVRAGSATFNPSHLAYFTSPSSPAVLGRYYKEDGARFVSSKLPAGIRPLRVTWTEIPCALWFDADNDGWAGDPVNGYTARNDQFGAGGTPGLNGLCDVRIDLEVWDDMGTVTAADDVNLMGTGRRFSDPAGTHPVPKPTGRLYYKAVFVNEWDAATRANFPLDVTPFLDDVTVTYVLPGGPAVLAWEEGGE